jgi:hypothetical protein
VALLQRFCSGFDFILSYSIADHLLRINVTAIWRLVVIVRTQAATRPVVDPTYLSVLPILLAYLEVTIAILCASIPIFWPVLQQSFGKIFVTQVVEIKHEPRSIYANDDSESMTPKKKSEDFELGDVHGFHKDVEGPHQQKVMGHNRALNGSQSSMESLRALNKKISTHEFHYQDPYVVDRVEPWNSKTPATTIETNVEGPKQKKFWDMP